MSEVDQQPTSVATESNSGPMTSPQFEHDCSNCTFLGRFGSHDLYHCEQAGFIPTIVARYGSDGAEYVSGFEFVPYKPALAEALKRAKERGLRCE